MRWLKTCPVAALMGLSEEVGSVEGGGENSLDTHEHKKALFQMPGSRC